MHAALQKRLRRKRGALKAAILAALRKRLAAKGAPLGGVGE